uniref:Protein kinase domain-containing protein n=1 Tax=Alexandrium monilatum TaxID=311494 RepID=A0A7S4WDR3_9DINO
MQPAPDAAALDIIATTLGGKEYVLSLCAPISVREAKLRISAAGGPLPYQQCLLRGSVALENDASLGCLGGESAADTGAGGAGRLHLTLVVCAESWREVDVDRKVKFEVPSHLEFIRKVGSDAYGTVASFKDGTTGQKFAVKKVTDVFSDLVDGKAALREVKLLRGFAHDNIVRILDMYLPDGPDFDDVYIVTEFMETDLHSVIYSKQALTDEHYQYFIYQVLRAVLYLHSASVVHNNLQPSCLLVNRNCDLKVSSFLHAREVGSESPGERGSRWYGAPECVLLPSELTRSMDMWSVGCIHCELIGRRPIFRGRDHLDQIKEILLVVGTPSEDELRWLPQHSAPRRFIGKIPACKKRRWETIFTEANPACLEAIDRMLAFSPPARATAREAIGLPYFSVLRDPDNEPTADAPVDWAFDQLVPTKRLLQTHAYAECAYFRPEIAAREDVLALRGIDQLLE